MMKLNLNLANFKLNDRVRIYCDSSYIVPDSDRELPGRGRDSDLSRRNWFSVSGWAPTGPGPLAVTVPGHVCDLRV